MTHQQQHPAAKSPETPNSERGRGNREDGVLHITHGHYTNAFFIGSKIIFE